jgi:toxin ParE1/3/4
VASYRLSAAAIADIMRLLADTHEQFGEPARRRYEALLITAFRDIGADPERPGTVSRPDLGEGVRTYHLRHSRDRDRTRDGFVRKPRHILLFRMIRDDVIGLGRVLYDGMDVERHLPRQYGDEE